MASTPACASRSGPASRPALASSVARQRADDLADRLRSRTRELELEAQVQALPPVVVGGAIVVPRGLAGSPDRDGRRPEPELSPARPSGSSASPWTLSWLPSGRSGRVPKMSATQVRLGRRVPGARRPAPAHRGEGPGRGRHDGDGDSERDREVPQRARPLVSRDRQRRRRARRRAHLPTPPILAGAGPCGDVGELLDQGSTCAGRAGGGFSVSDRPRRKLIEVACRWRRSTSRRRARKHPPRPPSTLHLWWARRPLAACRAVLFA